MSLTRLHDEWSVLYKRSRELDACLPELKRDAYGKLKAACPAVTQKHFTNIWKAYKAGRFTPEIAAIVERHLAWTAALVEEAAACRKRSDKLLIKMHAADKRPTLNPMVDPIPAGDYPQLRDCKTYPLRLSCNWGENEICKWNRCEFMHYVDGASILDSLRWRCIAPE